LVVGDTVEHRRAFVRDALVVHDPRKPRYSEDGMLVVHDQLGEILELRAANLGVGGVEQCAHCGSLTQI
jgi:hypothetical protein